MSTLDPSSLRAALSFPAIGGQHAYRPGAYSPPSISQSNNFGRTSRLGNNSKSTGSTVRSSETAMFQNRRTNSPGFNLAQHPSPSLSVVSYRRLGMPRSREIMLLPEFMRIDLAAQQSPIKLDSLPERMKLLDLFMANFADQFGGSKKPKSPPPSRSVMLPTPDMRRSYTDVDDLEIRANMQSQQLSLSSGDTDMGGQPLMAKRSQTPTIASRTKRQNKPYRLAANQKERPGSYVPTKTFDTSMLKSESPQLAAAIVTLTRKDKNVPLTFSGDVRAPAPSLVPREIPELWSTVSSQQQLLGTKQEVAAKTLKLQLLLDTDNLNGQQQDARTLPVESLNVANIKRLLQANKVNIMTQQEEQAASKLQSRSNTVVSAAIANRNNLARSRSMSPVVRAIEKRVTPPRSPVGSKHSRQSSPNRPKSPGKTDTVFLTQSRENSSLPEATPTENAERVPSSMKSTKTVRFQLVEDVRFYTPESAPGQAPPTNRSNSNKVNLKDETSTEGILENSATEQAQEEQTS